MGEKSATKSTMEEDAREQQNERPKAHHFNEQTNYLPTGKVVVVSNQKTDARAVSQL